MSPSQKETSAFLAYWRAHVCERSALLRRSDFDPAAIKPILPNVWLFERLAEREYFCRVAGEEVNLRWQRAISRKLLRDVSSPQERPIIQDRFEIVIRRRLLAFGATEIRDGWVMERIYGPVLDEAGEARFILGCSSPVPREAVQSLADVPFFIEPMSFFDPITLGYVPVSQGSAPGPSPGEPG